MSNNEIYLAITVMAFANFLTRVFPFLFFKNTDVPEILEFIQKYFPAIIMTILIFYSLSKIDFTIKPYGLKEIISILIIAFLHIKFKNYLVSIFLGTAIYMYLVQFL